MKEKDFHKLLEEYDPSLIEDKRQVLARVKKGLDIESSCKNSNEDSAMVKYFKEKDFVLVDTEQRLKDFYETDNNILYLDWYSDSNVLTSLYKASEDTKNILGIKEYITNNSANIELAITVSFENIQFEFIEKTTPNLLKEISIDNIAVKYEYDVNKNATACFKYNKYTYFIEFKNILKEKTIIDIVAELLKSKS